MFVQPHITRLFLNIKLTKPTGPQSNLVCMSMGLEPKKGHVHGLVTSELLENTCYLGVSYMVPVVASQSLYKSNSQWIRLSGKSYPLGHADVRILWVHSNGP